jgi:hypothetical protein
MWLTQAKPMWLLLWKLWATLDRNLSLSWCSYQFFIDCVQSNYPHGIASSFQVDLCHHILSLQPFAVIGSNQSTVWNIYILGMPSLLALVKVCWISTTLEFLWLQRCLAAANLKERFDLNLVWFSWMPKSSMCGGFFLHGHNLCWDTN